MDLPAGGSSLPQTTEPPLPIAYATPILDATGSAVYHSSGTTVSSSFFHSTSSSTTSSSAMQRHSLPSTLSDSGPTSLSEDALQVLLEQGYTRGLIRALNEVKVALPLRIWIIDNSESMSQEDGHRLVAKSGDGTRDLKSVDCTRWEELQTTVTYHVQLAATLRAPTVFRFLNPPGKAIGPRRFSIAQEPDRTTIDQQVSTALSIVNKATPRGVTPLLGHLQKIHDFVSNLTLAETGAKVALVLSTDGVPTDERGYTNRQMRIDFSEKLRTLQSLPVWIVVRLCTDDPKVVDYWNEISKELELQLDVLHNFTTEAKLVEAHNPWLNYGLPLHRLREMGCHNRVLDLLDMVPLSHDELFRFCKLLLFNDLPHPRDDFNQFVAKLTELLEQEKTQWNPRTKRMEPWIHMGKLKRCYGGGLFSSFFGSS